MKIILATRNRDKVGEIQHILEGLDVELATLDDYPEAPETVEDMDTLDGNALKKAREIRDHTGLPALADDTGLEVDALDGAPGVYSARYAGGEGGAGSNRRKLLRELDGVVTDNRTARFRCVIALALPHDRTGDEDALVTEGVLDGLITHEPRGEGGFGYDPVFEDPESGRTLSEMSAEEKNAMSHRYRALVEMRELMLRMGLAGEIPS